MWLASPGGSRLVEHQQRSRRATERRFAISITVSVQDGILGGVRPKIGCLTFAILARACSMNRLAIAFVALASCAHAGTWLPEESDLTCRTDADCLITTFGGCCGCSYEPYAISRAALEEKTMSCAVVQCGCVKPPCSCPKTSDLRNYRAVCENNHCARREAR